MPLCLTRREVEATDAAVVPALLEVREDYSRYTLKCILSCNKCIYISAYHMSSCTNSASTCECAGRVGKGGPKNCKPTVVV